jgi:predicted nucleic acid-binding protein
MLMRCKVSVCLDAFALLAWLQDEVGADEVEKYIERAANEEDFVCYLSTINLGEIFYRLLRVRGVDEAEAFWEDASRGSLPVTLVNPTRNRIREASRIKGQYPVAYADAFATQVALEKRVSLVTGDQELRVLEEKGLLSIDWLHKY